MMELALAQKAGQVLLAPQNFVLRLVLPLQDLISVIMALVHANLASMAKAVN